MYRQIADMPPSAHGCGSLGSEKAGTGTGVHSSGLLYQFVPALPRRPFMGVSLA